jgi:hypothetical protein
MAHEEQPAWVVGYVKGDRMSVGNIIWLVVFIVVALWLIGLVTRVAGGLIHLLLIVALILIVYNLVTGRRAM